MKNIYFIFAHLDDETILSYGTIKKYVKNSNITLISFCGKGRSIYNSNRVYVFKKICTALNIKYIMLNYNDLQLTSNIIKYELDNIFFSNKPDVIFTHSIHDIHFEHRLIAEETLIKFRPCSTVKKFLTTTSPTYTWTNQEFGVFNPNFFVDISDYIDDKKLMLMLYDMEIPLDTDNRSIDSIINQNKLYGFQMNTNYCEAYLLLWSKE